MAPIWREEQEIEMKGLFARGCLRKLKRNELEKGTRIIGSRFQYKIKRHSAGALSNKVKRLKVRLVVQGQFMSKEKGDFKNNFAPVPHLAGIRSVMSVSTAKNWKSWSLDLT